MNPLAPYMNMIKIGIVLALVAAFAGMYIHIETLKKDKEELTALVGAKKVVIANQRQVIADIELDKARLKEEIHIRERAIGKHQKTIEGLKSDDKKHRIEIDSLKRKIEIRNYLSTPVDIGIISLFNVRGSDSDQDGISDASGSPDEEGGGTLYFTESVVNYALDVQLALRTCNANLESIRIWSEGVEALNGG